MSNYAIISVGGKQYRVREGERLLVDRLPHGEGATFQPVVLLTGGEGGPDLSPSTTVTARVVADVKGEKIRIGKYRPKNGYRKHTGFRASLSQIEIESIGGGKRSAKKTETKVAAPKADAPTPQEAPKQAAAPQAVPAGYADLTVAQVKEQAASWDRAELEAALAYEQGSANRKGALAALESALAEKENG